VVYNQAMNNRPIGLFDSGVGGLTILSQLAMSFENESFLYYADSNRAPYGNKSKSELYSINKNIIEFLLDKKIKCLVVACNTSDALFFDQLKSMLKIPVIGIINSLKNKIEDTPSKSNYVVLATKQTVSSHAYKKAIKAKIKKAVVEEIACPELVPLIESNSFLEESGIDIARRYLSAALTHNPDTIVCGCSHYPYFLPIWKKFTPSNVSFIDPSMYVAKELSDVFEKLNLRSDSSTLGKIEYWVNGNSESFKSFLEHVPHLQSDFIRSVEKKHATKSHLFEPISSL
jgi:glutamate racemase